MLNKSAVDTQVASIKYVLAMQMLIEDWHAINRHFAFIIPF